MAGVRGNSLWTLFTFENVEQKGGARGCRPQDQTQIVTLKRWLKGSQPPFSVLSICSEFTLADTMRTFILPKSDNERTNKAFVCSG